MYDNSLHTLRAHHTQVFLDRIVNMRLYVYHEDACVCINCGKNTRLDSMLICYFTFNNGRDFYICDNIL